MESQPNRYRNVLWEGVKREIVEGMTNLFDRFTRVENADPTLMPYLEGERWVDVAEDVIKVGA